MLADKIQKVEIREAQQAGSFDVFLDDDLVYSKKNTGRVPHPGEVEQIIIARIG